MISVIKSVKFQALSIDKVKVFRNFFAEMMSKLPSLSKLDMKWDEESDKNSQIGVRSVTLSAQFPEHVKTYW